MRITAFLSPTPDDFNRKYTWFRQVLRLNFQSVGFFPEEFRKSVFLFSPNRWNSAMAIAAVLGGDSQIYSGGDRHEELYIGFHVRFRHHLLGRARCVSGPFFPIPHEKPHLTDTPQDGPDATAFRRTNCCGVAYPTSTPTSQLLDAWTGTKAYFKPYLKICADMSYDVAVRACIVRLSTRISP